MPPNSQNMDDQDVRVDTESGQGYALSGKIMLSAIVILFAVVLFMVCLHLYARWYLLRLRRRQLERRRQRRNGRTHVVFYADNQQIAPNSDRGLEPEVLQSLPVFLHAAKPDQQLLECAVCLSEFEEKDIVRLLPKCDHSFHIECIDMWFHSHSTCPLCRSPVEPVAKPVEPDVVVSEPVCATCRGCSANDRTTSSSSRRKGIEVRIEVPPRRVELENELTQSSPASRILRMLSMGRTPRGGNTTPSGAGPSCGPSGLDLESGSSRALTPR